MTAFPQSHHPHHHDTEQEVSSVNRLALTATVHCLTGCSIGEVLGMVFDTAAGMSNAATVVISVILAFIFGYALTLVPLAPLMIRRGHSHIYSNLFQCGGRRHARVGPDARPSPRRNHGSLLRQPGGRTPRPRSRFRRAAAGLVSARVSCRGPQSTKRALVSTALAPLARRRQSVCSRAPDAAPGAPARGWWPDRR